MVGIGRSIYAVFDRQLLAHALERIHQSLVRGVASPSAQFVTTTQGRAVAARAGGSRARRGDDGVAAQATQAVVSGFVLLLNNVTASVEEGGGA